MITDYELRKSQCKYVLPQCNLDVFKRSFVNRSIFSLQLLCVFFSFLLSGMQVSLYRQLPIHARLLLEF